jgi:predicted permease
MALLRRLLNLLRPERLAREIDRELSFHLAERTDELIAGGMSPAAAETLARRQLGHRTGHAERTRDENVVEWFASLAADLRYAFRAMRKAPAFTTVAVLSLALGIGANTAIFSLVNAVLIRTLPVPRPDELVVVTDGEGNPIFTNPLWEAIRDSPHDRVALFAYDEGRFDLAQGGPVRPVSGLWVSGGFFQVLGVVPLAGRLLAPADDVRGCPGVAVLSAGFAEREFSSAEGAVGRSVTLEGHPFTVVGVTDPGFTGIVVGEPSQVYLPICAQPLTAGSDTGRLDARSRWWLRVIGRLTPGSALAAARGQLAGLAPAIREATVPQHWGPEDQRRYLARSLTARPSAGGQSALRRDYGEALWVLLAVVGAVLLIACANVAHLLLARAVVRQREMAVRLAMGAGRGRLVRQLLTESLVLALIGAALGALFARWASALMVNFISTSNQALWLDLSPDARVLGFTVLIATLTGVLFGMAPAWRATRVTPQEAMKAQGRGTTAARPMLGKALVVAQVALSMMLVIAAGLLVSSFRRLVTLDPGFERDGVLLVGADYSSTGLESVRTRLSHRALVERFRALPGVTSASASWTTPISGSGWNDWIVVNGDSTTDRTQRLVWFNAVTPDWFRTLGARLVLGRDFRVGDGANAPRVAVVNEAFVRRYFPNASPLGKTFQVQRSETTIDPPIEIIGVTRDLVYGELGEKVEPGAYLPLLQTPLNGQTIVFELRGADPERLIPGVTAVAAQEHRALALSYTTLGRQVSESVRRPRLLATLSGFFGGLALLLAVIGLYGTLAYGVTRRKVEIGVRLVLGAARERVLRMVLGEALGLVLGGVALGVLGALAATRLLESFLFGVTRTDPGTFTVSALLLGTVGIAAAVIPAWRAASVDPAETLRSE